MDEEIKNNPWDVQDLEEFLYFCCPECDEKNSSKELFVKHALDEHPKAKNKIEKLKIKLELNENFIIKKETYIDTIDASQYYEMNVSALTDNNEEQDFEVIKSEIEKDFEDDEILKCEIKEEVNDQINEFNDIYEQAEMENYNLCEICNKSFTRKAYLKKHIEVVHEGIRNHK